MNVTQLTRLAFKKTTTMGLAFGAFFAAVHVVVTVFFVPQEFYDSSATTLETVTYPCVAWLVLLAVCFFAVTLRNLSSRAKMGACEFLGHFNRVDPGIVRILEPRSPSWAQLEAVLVAENDGESSSVLSGSAVNKLISSIYALKPKDRPQAEEDAPATTADLRWLRIRDMVSGCGELLDEQRRRQRLVFDRLISPLVNLAVMQPLNSASKTLLIEAVAATGFKEIDVDHREHYRAEFDALLKAAMNTFEALLESELRALGDGPPAGKTLLAAPKVEFFGNSPSCIFQDGVVGLKAPWRISRTNDDDSEAADVAPSISRACAVLTAWGALDGAVEFSDLMQSGLHPLFRSPKPNAFTNSSSSVFWMHIGSLMIVAQSRKLDAEFQECVARFAARFPGVFHKPAPVKECDRVLVKAQEYFTESGLPDSPSGGLQGAGRVADVMRCSLCVKDAETAVAVLDALDATTIPENQLTPLRRKSGFAKDTEALGGYRDIKYNMRFESRKVSDMEGVAVTEIQVILQSYLDVKKRMHAIYRVNRGDFG